MTSFEPHIFIEPNSFLKYCHDKTYSVGEKYGVVGNAIVISNDGHYTTICYSKSEVNCRVCPEVCPFSSNPSRKEG